VLLDVEGASRSTVVVVMVASAPLLSLKRDTRAHDGSGNGNGEDDKDENEDNDGEEEGGDDKADAESGGVHTCSSGG
jgi:hypothetical protein